MRRKGTENLAIEPIIHMIVKLILLMVGIAFITIVATGEGNKLLDSIEDVMGNMGCKEKLGTVDFQKFMQKMDDKYEACKSDANKCGSKTCMTLDLGAGGTYHEIDGYVLDNYGLKDFNFYNFWVFLDPKKTAITCEAGNGLAIDEISAYYPGGIKGALSSIYADAAKNIEICHNYDPFKNSFFAVADGSKVKITATRNKALFVLENTDLKVEISGGQFTNNVAAPAAPTCKVDSNCTKTAPWGVCGKDTHCVYDYCRNDKSPKCKEYTVVCERDDTPTTEESDTVNCEPPSKPMTCDLADTYFKQNKYTIEPYRMIGISLDPKKPSDMTTAIRFKVYDGNGASDIQSVVGSESAWMLNRWPFSWRTNEKDPTAKVSLSIGTVAGPNAGKYAASLLMGCY